MTSTSAAAGAFRDVRLTFAPDTPDEVISAATPIIVRYLPLVPRWCSWVNVRFASQNANSPNADAEIKQGTAYGWAHITLYGEWLRGTEFEREETIAHELAHTDRWRLLRRQHRRPHQRPHQPPCG